MIDIEVYCRRLSMQVLTNGDLKKDRKKTRRPSQNGTCQQLGAADSTPVHNSQRLE